ncbi:acetyl-CoA carboxylase biotin carboxyl carrier protein subunit [Desulfosporosinus sp. BICA1-9]|uniref:acetyl-CoA carboxylase biotin carboxyl carrier protein subunit n=1 Tax=Desulfosporosinus sp. BICA1-9 TaxID=1531958 RepID=UPI000B2312CB|nr:acetyl-CoA carboxylase biotin carboxyl carrier protein subunit [Desulfosporosinus sp. BICA1-9]
MALIEVKAETTGMVWKIGVKLGDRVSEDDTMITMESMKMEVPLLAPEDGTVKEILVKEEDPISEGDVAIILEV